MESEARPAGSGPARYVVRKMFHQVIGDVFEVVDTKSGLVRSLRTTMGAALDRCAELERGDRDGN
jgi:hypothetical protein